VNFILNTKVYLFKLLALLKNTYVCPCFIRI